MCKSDFYLLRKILIPIIENTLRYASRKKCQFVRSPLRNLCTIIWFHRNMAWVMRIFFIFYGGKMDFHPIISHDSSLCRISKWHSHTLTLNTNTSQLTFYVSSNGLATILAIFLSITFVCINSIPNIKTTSFWLCVLIFCLVESDHCSFFFFFGVDILFILGRLVPPTPNHRW